MTCRCQWCVGRDIVSTGKVSAKTEMRMLCRTMMK